VLAHVFSEDWRRTLTSPATALGFSAVRQYEQPRIADDSGGPLRHAAAATCSAIMLPWLNPPGPSALPAKLLRLEFARR